LFIDALQERLRRVQGSQAGTRQLLRQRIQAVQRMRAVSKVERIKMSLLQKDFEDKAAQHKAQGENALARARFQYSNKLILLKYYLPYLRTLRW
jgi:hypothetical protein